MRKGHIIVAAVCGFFGCGSAQAQQTVTTTGTTNWGTVIISPSGAFTTLAPFDPSLGTLTGVSLEIDASIQDTFGASSNSGTLPDLSGVIYNWEFDATVNGTKYVVPLNGSGASPGIPRVLIDAGGTATFAIDPSLFNKFISSPGVNSIPVDAMDFPATTPTLFGVPDGVTFRPDEWEALGRYTLTYAYIPVGQAVPEPSTWAMMLLGFGGCALAIRRRRRPNLA